MVTNQEYENVYLLTRKMVHLVNTLADNSELYKYLTSLGYEFDDNDLTLKSLIHLFVEQDILNCYFYLNYQQTYNHKLFILFNTIVYAFFVGDIPWAYNEYQNIEDTHRCFWAKMFDIAKDTLASNPFPNLFINLSKVDSTKAEDYINLLQKIAITLSKNQLGKKKQIDERIDILLSNPKLFLSGNDEDNDSQQLEDDNIVEYINEHYNMELLKDKLFNGISLEIINDGYIKSNNYYSIIIKVTNHNEKKKKVQLKARYISIEEGLLDTYGSIDILGGNGSFLQPNSFVKAAMDFEKLTKLHNQDRIELDINEGAIASLLLVRENGQWYIKQQKETYIVNNDLKKKIEQFEAIEEQLGITLQNFSVKVEDENSMKVFCEVLALNGEIPENDFTINIAIYDNNNEIVYTDSESKYAEDFKGFEVLTFDRIRLDITVDEISKIRIYPTR